MALTPSSMLALGTVAPDFTLPDTNGNNVSLADFGGRSALVVVFMCNHCPYVVHLREGLAQFGRDYASRGVGIVGINANDVKNYPADSPARMKAEVVSAGYTFPYLYDETQAVARAYQAACTPDFFLFDGHHKLVYRGLKHRGHISTSDILNPTASVRQIDKLCSPLNDTISFIPQSQAPAFLHSSAAICQMLRRDPYAFTKAVSAGWIWLNCGKFARP